MATFAHLIEVEQLKTVKYFSVVITEEPLLEGDSLFDLFVEKQKLKNKSKLQHILDWIELIGNSKRGANENIFRFENDASALPPEGKDREPCYLENDINTPNDLRLYCFRANEHVVILFNGDIKTTETAQECPNVKPHFDLANKLSKKLNQLFGKEIFWNSDCTDISVEDDFYFEL